MAFSQTKEFTQQALEQIEANIRDGGKQGLSAIWPAQTVSSVNGARKPTTWVYEMEQHSRAFQEDTSPSGVCICIMHSWFMAISQLDG